MVLFSLDRRRVLIMAVFSIYVYNRTPSVVDCHLAFVYSFGLNSLANLGCIVLWSVIEVSLLSASFAVLELIAYVCERK